MHAIAINGSPRINGNTATLLRHALQGAESAGADTEFVNLYTLAFRGCTSCFACKRKGNACHGLCAMRDDLTGVLSRVHQSDILLLGSPIYFGAITGEMRCFLERLLFACLSYNEGERSVYPGKTVSGFLYTMNVPEGVAGNIRYDAIFLQNQNLLGLLNGPSEILAAYDTYQFSDYEMYNASRFNEPHKAQVRKDQFPLDCQKAHDLGVRLVQLAAAGV